MLNLYGQYLTQWDQIGRFVAVWATFGAIDDLLFGKKLAIK